MVERVTGDLDDDLVHKLWIELAASLARGMSDAQILPSTLAAQHAVDAPFTDPDDWARALIPGICTACGGEAYAGQIRWWHYGCRVCPDRKQRTPGFAADP